MIYLLKYTYDVAATAATTPPNITNHNLLLGCTGAPLQDQGFNIVPNAYGNKFLTPVNQSTIPLGATN